MGVDAAWVQTIINEIQAKRANGEIEVFTGAEAVAAFQVREYMKEHPDDLAEIQVRAIVESVLWVSARHGAGIDGRTFDALRHTFKRWIDCAVGNASVHRSASAYNLLYMWAVDHLPPESLEDSPLDEP